MTSSEASEITFEHGYSRLQAIAARLNEEEVPVSEMCDLFAEGKGLEQALTTYLETQRARVERIERGEDIQVFRISAPGSPSHSGARPAGGDGHAATSTAVDDDIPF